MLINNYEERCCNYKLVMEKLCIKCRVRKESLNHAGRCQTLCKFEQGLYLIYTTANNLWIESSNLATAKDLKKWLFQNLSSIGVKNLKLMYNFDVLRSMICLPCSKTAWKFAYIQPNQTIPNLFIDIKLNISFLKTKHSAGIETYQTFDRTMSVGRWENFYLL